MRNLQVEYKISNNNLLKDLIFTHAPYMAENDGEFMDFDYKKFNLDRM